MSDVFGMLVFDTVILAIVGWYVHNVFPGEYGIAKPWNFFLKRSYWTGESSEDKGTLSLVSYGDHAELGDKDAASALVEPLPSDTRYAIQVQDVTKVFEGVGGPKVAVNHLSMDFVANHINVLLGQNGAGKTTVMSMMVGYFSATAGRILMNGVNVFENAEVVRKSLGFCPQFSVLFQLMTVREHLWFFARLKGLHGDELKAEVDSFVDKLDVRERENVPTRVLSGGQKRAVSVALALIGKPSIVVLDEPTSGLYPPPSPPLSLSV